MQLLKKRNNSPWDYFLPNSAIPNELDPSALPHSQCYYEADLTPGVGSVWPHPSFAPADY